MRPAVAGVAVLSFLLLPAVAFAQGVTHRGFLEGRVLLYPQSAPNDDTRAVADALVRYETSLRLAPWLSAAGAIDARADSHDQVERRWAIDVGDSTIRRPALSIRRLGATVSWRHVTADAGKQFIRWGKADLVNPTDRFAPRDFLAVVDNEFLAVTAARLMLHGAAASLDLVWLPRFTPSRVPLFDQRWTVVPDEAAGLALEDLGAQQPGGAQLGARLNHLAAGFEYSVSFYQGYNHLPLFDVRAATPTRVGLTRTFPPVRMYGADAAVPLPWFTLKGEAGYFISRGRGRGSSDPPSSFTGGARLPDLPSDDYVLYVIQAERLIGEWALVGGYVGELVTEARTPQVFAPDRGLTRAFVGRASCTVDVKGSLALEGALRQSGEGSLLKMEYSQARGQHWRTTVAFGWLRGRGDDFLGQFHRNSHATVTVRYSF